MACNLIRGNLNVTTSSYKYFKDGRYLTCSISGDRGKKARYTGKCFPELAPKLSFWKIWHENIGKISEEENNRYYVEEYYKQVLSKLDPQEIYGKLEYCILLCYEEGTEFCHRHIVAEWFKILLGVEIPEVKIIEGKAQSVDRPPYIKEYLIEAMKKDRNMREFTSLRALYLFEKGEELEEMARQVGEKDARYYDYMQLACFCRCDADEAEEEFKHRNKVKTTILN